MIRKISKKGISPVIATVLLVAIAIIVVTIIWFWASRSVKDVGSKFETPLNQACQELNLDVSISGSDINIVNSESQFSLEKIVLKDDSGSLYECSMNPIAPGDSSSITLSDCSDNGNSASGKTIVSVIPVLKGDNEELYNCDNNEVEV